MIAQGIRQLRAKIYGRVQLVMFRDFVTRTARSLGISGSVRNLDDGSVEVIAEGIVTDLETLVHKLHKGSILSKVERVELIWEEPKGLMGKFYIDYGT